MAGHLDEAEIGIDCPNCGHHFEKTVAGIKREGEFACPGGCGALFRADQFNAGIEQAEKSLAQLRRALGKLGKRR